MATISNKEEDQQTQGMNVLQNSAVGSNTTAPKTIAAAGPAQTPYQQKIAQIASQRAKLANGGVIPRFEDGGTMNVLGEQPQQEDKKSSEDEGTSTPMSQPSGPATIGTSAPTSAPGQAPGSTGKSQSGSGNFVNLSQYRKANAPKTQQVANRITSGLTDQKNKLISDIAAKRGQLTGEGSLYQQQQAKLGETGEQAISNVVNQAGQGLTDEQKQQFAGYIKPEKLNYQDPTEALAAQRAQELTLKEQGQRLGTGEGREAALGRTVGKESARYTQGQRGLDSALLGSDRNTRAQLAKTGKQIAGALGEQASAVTGEVSQAYADQLAERKRLADFALEQATGARTKLEEDLAARAEQANLTSQESVDRINKYLAGDASVQLTPEERSMLGLGDSQFAFGMDLSQYAGLTPQQATAQSVANQEDLARYQALQSLMGQTEGDYSQVGTYQGPLAQEQLESLGSGVGGAIKQRQQEYSNKAINFRSDDPEINRALQDMKMDTALSGYEPGDSAYQVRDKIKKSIDTIETNVKDPNFIDMYGATSNILAELKRRYGIINNYTNQLNEEYGITQEDPSLLLEATHKSLSDQLAGR